VSGTLSCLMSPPHIVFCSFILFCYALLVPSAHKDHIICRSYLSVHPYVSVKFVLKAYIENYHISFWSVLSILLYKVNVIKI
jgi:hypothetical protein